MSAAQFFSIVLLTHGGTDTASPEFKDNPNFGDHFDMNQFLTSPLPDLLHDFDGSPEETPYTDFLTTPVIPNNDDEIFPAGEYDMNMPLFPMEHSVTAGPVHAPAKAVEQGAPPFDLDALFTISPGTPMIDTPAMDPVSLYNTPLLPVSSEFSPASHSASLPRDGRRRSSATGTRKGITPESLVPLDAPTQSRKYVLPSATSRKEVPAVFARKRGRSVAFEDEEDELDGEKAPGPNATEKEQIEWKRRQNTLAARKSRKRKLEHQQQLESRVTDLTREKEVWKTRALTFRQLLVSHGIPFNEFQD
ncbi:hypothetical protein FA13DRAFT_1639136 [Coprinellus micaceus]|uniref:BZIP domain-containing protein n=1 Tax=Coprinellus micaceus TaxID=71717 RepID=A0A4Y7SQC2_COPMI|nr:hypothetical protein FA13DRAFT_1639136 [Coprinellus micaceus]